MLRHHALPELAAIRSDLVRSEYDLSESALPIDGRETTMETTAPATAPLLKAIGNDRRMQAMRLGECLVRRRRSRVRLRDGARVSRLSL